MIHQKSYSGASWKRRNGLEYSVKSEISKLTNLIMGQKDIDVLKIWHKTEIYHLEKLLVFME